MKYVLIGKIVNTHGLKGEVRILSSFKYKDRVFKPDMNIYIGKNKINEVINSYRHHKIFEMITMNGYNNIKNEDIPEKMGIVIGNEGRGISDKIKRLCNKFIYIGMNESCESLNASVAASILMYEVNNK
jgi:tRNA G18 (ribose-2'-O)-methylase SpoU